VSQYTKATNFAVKDGYSTGNPAKVVKGTEIDAEFTAIASAVASKADSNSPTLTGTPLAPTAAAGTNTTQIATTAFVATERTATTTFTNKTISVDDNTISGVAASSFVLSNASGNIDGSASQKAIPSGAVVGTTDSQTLTNKTVALGSNTVSGTKSEFNTSVTDTDFSFVNDFTGSNQSLTTDGYQKLPGGLIIQWGTADDTDLTVSFPVAFPNDCLNVIMNLKDVTLSSGFAAFYLSTTNWTTTGFTKNTALANLGGKRPWIAIGY
jgi:hypothetical protein